ncbi:putative metal-dependent hydrolase [Dissulfuribacter thermophilus]|uniref:Putative metal-dependent hydrolase n=1 Tax=Dissulfuribacter thermophilus TaxID=1156395 RepID=A0A1B9F9P1_9BACT|nr:putative metal-dependent hydrolase [Dissulfuribacter thermophilus]
MVDGETHYFLGKRYLLRVFEAATRPRIEVNGNYIHLFIRLGTGRERRIFIFNEWYRSQLK